MCSPKNCMAASVSNAVSATVIALCRNISLLDDIFVYEIIYEIM